VKVTPHRTKRDFAHRMRELVEYFPQARRIRVVLDNLNTHSPAAFYETFNPEEARRLVRKLEFHYTPKHGSWLNMAEIEIGVLELQCLNRRLPDILTVQREVAAWEDQRNSQKATVDWRFTTERARKKLQHLYPSKLY